MQWYLADVVLEHVIGGDPRNVVHVNSVWVRARSADEAYDKALAIGSSQENPYKNTDGRMVRTRFLGLGELIGPIDPIEHGAELSFSEFVGVFPRRIKALVVEKASLAAFARRGRTLGVPNYMPESVMRELERPGIIGRVSLGLAGRGKRAGLARRRARRPR